MYSLLRFATRVQWFGENDRSLRAVWKDVVYAHLEKAYDSIGGISLGSGFKDPEDMLRSIPVWRLVFEEERLVSVMAFKKKKGGLKMVAYAAEEASEAVKQKDIKCMMRRSYAEISGALLIAVLRQLGSSLQRHLLSPGDLLEESEILPLQESGAEVLQRPENARLLEKLKAEFPEVVSYLYVRKIGGRLKLKLLVGSLSNGNGTPVGGRVMAQSTARLDGFTRKALEGVSLLRAGMVWGGGCARARRKGWRSAKTRNTPRNVRPCWPTASCWTSRPKPRPGSKPHRTTSKPRSPPSTTRSNLPTSKRSWCTINGWPLWPLPCRANWTGCSKR